MATLGRPSLIDPQWTKDGRARVPILLPVAGQLGGAVAGEVVDRRVGGEGLEHVRLGQTFVEQKPDQADGLLLRLQLRRPRPEFASS